MTTVLFVIAIVSLICSMIFGRGVDSEGNKKKPPIIFTIILIICALILAFNSFFKAGRVGGLF